MEHIGVYQVGDAVVDLCEGVNGYWGTIFTNPTDSKNRRGWEFDGLRGPAIGVHDECELAKAACYFGGYYSTFNRGDDLPDWAPSEEIADAISNASWWAEEVVELEGLPDWCYEISID